MFKPEALGKRILTDTNPVDITLADMHNSHAIIKKPMQLSFKNRFKFLLHLSSGNFNHNAKRKRFLPLRNLVNIGADKLYFSVFYFMSFFTRNQFKCLGRLSSKLAIQLFAPDPLAFKGRAV